jgi:hypothetical protein
MFAVINQQQDIWIQPSNVVRMPVDQINAK